MVESSEWEVKKRIWRETEERREEWRKERGSKDAPFVAAEYLVMCVDETWQEKMSRARRKWKEQWDKIGEHNEELPCKHASMPKTDNTANDKRRREEDADEAVDVFGPDRWVYPGHYLWD